MLSWKVYWEEPNKRIIKEYDIFKNGYWENIAKNLKETFPKRKEWENHLRTQLMAQYWSRSEYEIILTSWPPYINIEDIDRINQEIINREKTWGTKPYKINITPTVERKIDIFEQLELNWEVFTDYIWNNI